MKDRPILMSGPMVRATRNDLKTQTRRIVKPEPWHVMRPKGNEPHWPYKFVFDEGSTTSGEPVEMRCPYGKPGDLLWVRETWAKHAGDIDPGDAITPASWVGVDGPLYRADGRNYDEVRWIPSIHMPRWASRLTLELTDVRVQRLMDISDEDAIAEGVKKVRDHCYVIPGFDYDLAGLCHTSPQTPFMKLWDSINEARGSGWDANPWVWALTFRVIKENIDRVIEARQQEGR